MKKGLDEPPYAPFDPGRASYPDNWVEPRAYWNGAWHFRYRFRNRPSPRPGTIPSIVEQYESLGTKHIDFEQTGMRPSLAGPKWKIFGPRVGVAYSLGTGGLRSAPQVIAGVNGRDVIRTGRPVGLTRGSLGVTYLNRHQPDVTIHGWNLTVEGEILPDTVARAA